jgi:hypothetical protein
MAEKILPPPVTPSDEEPIAAGGRQSELSGAVHERTLHESLKMNAWHLERWESSHHRWELTPAITENSELNWK